MSPAAADDNYLTCSQMVPGNHQDAAEPSMGKHSKHIVAVEEKLDGKGSNAFSIMMQARITNVDNASSAFLSRALANCM